MHTVCMQQRPSYSFLKSQSESPHAKRAGLF
jgi:hypothetical protein